ncbi:non-ribosomal peptide synthetase protein [Seiridium cupressi]
MPVHQDLSSSAVTATGENYAYTEASTDSMDDSSSPDDLDKLWEWNARVPDPVQGRVHDLITEVATSQPGAIAVDAWDGNFTYSELDALANVVAQRLIDLGCAPKSSIPILFSKSKWTCIAMLGVIKAGCSVIALDATQPDARLRSIVQQAQPSTIVSSAKHHARASMLGNVSVFQLDDTLPDTLDQAMKVSHHLPITSPSDLVYISFTSGTTGQPKGACISHANVRSAVHYQGEQLGFHRGCRVFDFAPYSFDVAWSNFLHTLCAGGCLCIASEEDMLSDLSSAITAFSATLINVTPTVLRTISPILPSLETVLLSGEMPYRENITQWAGQVRLLNTYGPTECTFKCAFSVLGPSQEGRPDIGRGIGFSTWIVDPGDSRRLVSVGAVGELYLEGPLVGQGYLSDAVKTASAFEDDPPWLLDGSRKFTGRRGRVYKTGDLVKYKPDGRLLFVGRKDASQLKVRGQRVEIGDVEHHVRACIGGTHPVITVIADVIRPRRSDSDSLVLFVVAKDQENERLRTAMDGLADKLQEVLPAFMIPSVYLPVDELPVASTGKVDRNRLRKMGNCLEWKEILELQASILSHTEFHEPSNEIERQLRQIWAEVLCLNSTRISTADSFLRLGGDSITAMKVVATARGKNLLLTVADHFKTPILSDLAQITQLKPASQDHEPVAPFVLLSGTSDSLGVREEAARLCRVQVADIEDIYPCTPLQQGMLAMTAVSQSRSPGGQDSPNLGNYVSRTAFRLPGQIDVEKFQKVWGSTVERASILRTRIVDLPGEGLVQVVLKHQMPLLLHARIEDFVEREESMGLGSPLCRAGLIESNPCHFVLEMHHAIFDGWSMELILDAMGADYCGGQTMRRSFSPFQPFIKHALATRRPEAAEFWRNQLKDSEAVLFPSQNHSPGVNLDLDHTISKLRWPQTGFTPATFIRSALSLLLAAYTNSNDVKYGATVSGRSAPVPDIERIAAPTIATVPVRVKVDWDQTVKSFLQMIQRYAVESTEYEQFGLQNIQRIDEEVKEASQFQVLLVVQPVRQKKDEKTEDIFAQPMSVIRITENGVPKETMNGTAHSSATAPRSSLRLVAKDGAADSMGMHNSYSMMIICQLEETGLTLKINFDSGAIDQKAVQFIAAQLEHLVRQLCTDTLAHSKMCDVPVLSEQDLAQIWDWNKVLPEAVEEPVVAMIDNRGAIDPDALAISAWDNELTYRQVQDVTNSLAGSLQKKGVGAGSVVVLSFQKSSWQIVSMISAFKVGAVVLPVTAPISTQRAREVFEAVRPTLVITSDMSEPSPFDKLVSTYSISELIQTINENEACVVESPGNRPEDPALILSTSGSTGLPKSILWSHRTLSSNVRGHGVSFGLTSTSRVFQFAGYEFDVSTVEALSTLSVGGCLCISSDSDRTNRLAGAINEAKADWLCLTPSAAETLAPEELPSLTTLVLTGEKLLQKTASKWAGSLDFVYNWYGPAEASVATSYRIEKHTWKHGISGRSTSGLTWLVDPRDPNTLAPVGAIAELCIEGPILASYTGDSGIAFNEKSFFTPTWLLNGYGEIPGRSGRVYRTGDMVQYDAEGNIIFIGRKQDFQRKLRGQRVDLGEIELHVQAFLLGQLKTTVVAEIFSLASGGAETLALFISPTSESEPIEDVMSFVKQNLPIEGLEAYLLEHLPPYMIPKVYIPIVKIPVSHTGKTDRRRLRQMGNSLTYEQLAAMQPSRQEAKKPSMGTEERLQQLWAETIGIEPQAIYANDNFFRLGGDSITAMRLVASARHQGWLLTVKTVFEAPKLEDMAKQMRRDSDSTTQEVPPFSLLGQGYSQAEARSYAARLCKIPESSIVDIYPCTALQQGLLALGVRRQGQYVSRSVLGLQPGIDTERLERAWLATVEKISLLRTRIIDLPGHGFMQLLLSSCSLRSGSDVDAYVRNDEQEPMGPGTELCRAAIINRNFILTIHHCIYDGNTLKMILNELESRYLGEPGMVATPFKNFMQHLSRIDPQEAAGFWKRQLPNLEARQFPVLPSAVYEPQANEDLDHSISLDWPRSGVTPSTILRSAWAILATQYTSSSDVIFAVTVSGRQADMKGVENCDGPTISTMPLAISVDWDETIEAFLGRLQRQMIERIPYDQYGLQNLQSPKGDLDSRLVQTLFIVQPVAEGKNFDKDNLLFKARSFSSNIETLGTDPFNNYALKVVCELATSGLRLCMSFDSNVVDKKQISRMAHQFETVIRQMCSEELAATKLDTVQTASGDDLDLLWAQNVELPQESDALVPDLIRLAALKEPEKVAIDAWDGQFSYRQVDELSTALGQSLINLGVTKGSVVALHFEKSKWVPVVQLGVFKAGAVDVLLSISVPDLRVARVFENLGVKLAVASDSRVGVVSQFARGFTVDELLQAPPGEVPTNLPVLGMKDSAAILVSSGSTGEPKQVLWSHRGIAANVKAHGEYLGIIPSSRIFQFASYDFDVGTIESMSALAHMACLCIPSESDRLDGTAAAINRYNANFLNITPSTAKALQPEDVPSISILVLSGENLLQEDVDRWKGRCHILNWYGAAEHPSTVCAADANTWHSGVIGSLDSKQPTLSWLVDLRNHNRLVPLGAVGEIASEGPLSSEGYVANPTLNEQRFRNDPIFLSSGCGPNRPGRQGQIFCSGDLGRYDTNGNLVYVGRKDAQVKIRGQLVAPEEVQHLIRKNLEWPEEVSVVVDAIRSQYSTNLTLVAFLNLATEDEVEQVTKGLNKKLQRVLPAYAIPIYYIPVAVFPKNASAKIDRARLREIGASFDPTQQASDDKRQMPTTTAERTLRELWCRVLGAGPDTISASDSFLRLGDSVQAMRLVGIARQQGLLLTVAEIFEHPRLEDMAKVIRNLEGKDEEDEIVPFALLDQDQDVELARQHAASECGVATDEIEDLFPCTPLQEGLLALTMKREGDYTGNTILELDPSVDLTRFREAWDRIVSTIHILRTRIIDLPGRGLVQAIVQRDESYTDANGIDDYLRRQSELSLGLGSPLMRYGLFSDSTVEDVLFLQQNSSLNNVNQQPSTTSEFMLKSDKGVKNRDRKPYYFALTMHHSIYDGLTTPLILETLEDLYNGVTPLRHCPFQSFIKYIGNRNKEAEVKFWEAQFQDLSAPQFPVLPSSTYEPQTNTTLMHSIKDITWRADNITPSTMIRAASALLCFQYSNSSDVVFGEVSAGRKVPMGGIERLVGPTIATVPIRVKVDGESNSSELLAALQSQAIRMIPYEQTGLSTIRHISDEAQNACQFQTLLVVQMPEEDMDMKDNGLFVGEVRRRGAEDDARYHGFQTYALSIICTPEANGLGVRFCFDSAVIDRETVQRMSQDFEQLLRRLSSPELDGAPLSDITSTRDQDLNQIWRWNCTVFDSVDRCVQDVITEMAQAQPEATAVCAWDGELTYGHLDRVSTNIAHRLCELGVRRDVVVPLYFGKSMFALVAFLGVVKAGGAGFLLDPTLPESQLRSFLDQIAPTLILSSPSNAELASRLVTNVLVLGPDSDLMESSANKGTDCVVRETSFVDPSSPLCVIFTSGSTGTPKGYILQHRNFVSAVTHQRTTLGLNSSSRVYDHASHASDATYWSTFHVLAAGGTLCIPSEVERKSCLEESVHRFGTTDLFLTPSTARAVNPSKIPTLRNIHLGGEQATKYDVSRWIPYAKTFVTYGPGECSASALYYNVPSPIPSKISIGRGVGVSTWILDPQSSDRLVPVGTAGELYLEGPLVGKGYLNDEKNTAISFIESPDWLRDGSPDGSVPGRSSRLFKTGDIVKYDPSNGALMFVSRKDGQATLHGQRIDFAEVEHHVRHCLNSTLPSSKVVAEVVHPILIGRPMLVAFIQANPADFVLNKNLDSANAYLHEHLPSHMVPAAFVPMESIPLLASGKTDRRRVREIAVNLTMDEITGGQGREDGDLPMTDSELRLQQLWATILGVSVDRIRTDSSFIRLGGDSISAMRLAALARSRGISLTVQNILQSPRLSEMANAMTSSLSGAAVKGVTVMPFSLLKDPTSKTAAVDYVSKHCSLGTSHIEDIFPCTSVQKSLLSMTAKADNSYVARYSLRLAPNVDVERLRNAWEDVSQKVAPILRYRIVDVPTEGLVQVQINEPIQWDTYDSIDSYNENNERRTMGLDTALTRLAIVKDSKTSRLWCFVTQHHAIYDGYSVGLLLTEVSKAYAGILDNRLVAPFQAFIKYVVGVNRKDAENFWRLQFAESETVPFPALPNEDYRPKADRTVGGKISGFKWQKQDATVSTSKQLIKYQFPIRSVVGDEMLRALQFAMVSMVSSVVCGNADQCKLAVLRAAWSILTSRYTGSEDVLFGAMVSGRQAPLAGIDRMIAPLISAVPVRVKFDAKQSVSELLRDIQRQSISMIAYEQTELLDIRRINAETELGTRFNTLLVVNPPEQSDYMDQGPFQHQPGFVSNGNGLDDFNPNAVMVMCQLTNTNELQLEISFDSKVIDEKQMERIAAQFEHILHQINTSTTQLVEDIVAVSDKDVGELWNWNASLPKASSECVHSLIGNTIKRQPQAPAICAWDGDLSYSDLDDLSSRLASHLVALGIGPGSIVPLCIEKSMWYPVAALGTMKAGAACVAMDSTQPEARLQSIVQQVDAKFVLSSAGNETLAGRLSAAKAIVVDRDHILDNNSTGSTAQHLLPEVCSSDVLYATHQAEVLYIKPGTRVFDFVSYNFDVSWSNHLQTLICGGCLCIPSEQERRNDIASAFNRMNCNYAYFTPSVAQSLEPSLIPELRTLAMGGEPIQNKEVVRWHQAENIIGIYGPAECAQALSFAHLSAKTRNNHVGHSYGARTWLVEPGRPERLAAIGAIGELVIEGPTVSRGYFGVLNKTTTAYIQDPLWLSVGPPGCPGRKGRVYVTGDLLRYNSDGSLDFIGRKDGMIKLRGQRIELTELEYHVRTSLRNRSICDGIAAEIINPQNNANRSLLAVFFSLAKEKATESVEETQAKLMQVMEGLEEKLRDRLPQYMVPGAYIHIEKIPMTTTNKTDRRSLRELGSSLTPEQLAEMQPSARERRLPSTIMEKRLQTLWATVLELDPASIGAESSFLRIGGESIAAMRLVSKAREQRLSLTVADIFRAPRLSEQALLITEIAGRDGVKSLPPFSLLNTDDPEAFIEEFVSPLIDSTQGSVSDIIPATDFQSLSILQALQDPPSRYPHWIFDLPANIDFPRLEQACTKLVNYFGILHTVFIEADNKFWQVLLSNFKPVYDEFDAKDEDVTVITNSACEQDLNRPRQLGRSFVRFIAIKHSSGAHKLIFRISHAQFDGFSWGIVLQTLSSIYVGEHLPPVPTFGQYIAFNETRKEESIRYWASKLQGTSQPSWSASDPTGHVYSTEHRLTIQESIPMPNTLKGDEVSTATLFHAACAIALARQFEQTELVFGRLVTGRSMLPGNLQNVVGPTMTEMPIVISINENDDLSAVATKLQSQFIEDATYEAVGMVEIIRNCTSWAEDAGDFGWRTAFQQAEDAEFTFLGSPSSIGIYQRNLPPRSRPEIYATPRDGVLELELEGNTQLVSRETLSGFPRGPQTFAFMQISPNNRAGCKDTVCKKEAKKITKGEIRFGTWVTIMEHASWQWRHWGCVSGESIKHLQDAIERNGSYDYEMIDGWEDLEEHPDVRDKIKRVLEQGHIDPEDFNGDPEMNRPGQKGIRGRAKKAKTTDEDDEPSSSAPKKRGRKKAEAADDEEEVQPKKRAKKAAPKAEAEDEKPVTKGRAKKAATKVEPEGEDEKPAAKGRAKRATKKAAVKEESDEEPEPEEEPAPVKKSRGRKAAVKKEPTPEEEEEAEEPEEPEEPAPKAKGRGGRKSRASAAAEDAAPAKPRRGRPRKSAAADED